MPTPSSSSSLPCTLPGADGRCPGHRPGHALHPRQLGAADAAPWGWRPGVVTRVAANGWLDLEVTEEHRAVRVWHHQSCVGVVAVGDGVRVHEEFDLLATSATLVCVEVVGGLGVVGPPALEEGQPRPCVRRYPNHTCSGGGQGHWLHWVQAGLAAKTPWGWRDAVVWGHDRDGWALLTYVAEGAPLRVWHHQPLAELAPRGEVVRVHERYHVLLTSAGMVNVIVAGGLGPVPEPEHPELWAHEKRVAVTDNATGRAWLPSEEMHRDA